MTTNQTTFLIHCGRLIDSLAEEPISKATILVEDGNITAVGKNVHAPSNAQVIDLSHATVLPGLMDMHCHLLYYGSTNDFMFHSSGSKALYGMRNAQTMLNCGFTTIRIPGDVDSSYAAVDIRNAIASGQYIGPRIKLAPHLLTICGGHADVNDIPPDMPAMAFGKVVSGPTSMRQTIREQIKYGADWIKLCVSGGVMSAHDDPRVQSFTDEEIQAAVDEAHRFRKKVCVHAHGTQAIKTSLRAGVDSIEHGILIDEEGVDLLLERNAFLVPTVYVLNYIVEEGASHGIPEHMIAKGRDMIKERDRNIKAAFEAGVNIALGSDSIYPHVNASREFGHMARLGLTPLQVIKAATINPATLLGLESEIGTIEAGKRADIVAVSEDPLDDVRALERVKFVMKDGRVIKNEYQ